ncbi:MAG: DUF4256 domain-containing protein [Patescibacteria group bacterium]
MEATTGENTDVPAKSGEHEEELREKLRKLEEQETGAQDVLAGIQEEKRSTQEELYNLLDSESTQPDALELTPEMADEAIAALKAEFDKGAKGAQEAGYVVQDGVDFAAVEAKLRAEENEEQLKAVYRMVRAGSRPAVVCEEGGRYCIAETFGQTLPERANCVYDRKTERQVGREHCNGNAVTQSQKMGVPLMERRIAQAHITRFPDSNQYCYDYIQATAEERKIGFAPCVYRDFGRADVSLFNAHRRYADRGWRGALWV